MVRGPVYWSIRVQDSLRVEAASWNCLLMSRFWGGREEGGREGGREGEREGGREGGRQRQREGERKGGREGSMDG